MQFGAEAELLQDLTNSASSLQQGLKRLRLSVPVGGLHPGPVPTMQNQAGTILYDAVYLSVDHVKAGKKDKKALLLISDGEDNVSKYGLNKVVEALRESKVTLYAIGLLEDFIKQRPDQKDQRDVLLDQLKETFPLLRTARTKDKPLGWMAKEDWEETQEIMFKYGGLEQKA